MKIEGRKLSSEYTFLMPCVRVESVWVYVRTFCAHVCFPFLVPSSEFTFHLCGYDEMMHRRHSFRFSIDAFGFVFCFDEMFYVNVAAECILVPR